MGTTKISVGLGRVPATCGMVPHVLELRDQLFSEVVVDGGNLERTWHAGKKVAIVGALQVELQIWNKVQGVSVSHFSQTQVILAMEPLESLGSTYLLDPEQEILMRFSPLGTSIYPVLTLTKVGAIATF